MRLEIVGTFARYFSDHMEREEALMRRHAYSDAKAHIEEHKHAYEQLEMLKRPVTGMET